MMLWIVTGRTVPMLLRYCHATGLQAVRVGVFGRLRSYWGLLPCFEARRSRDTLLGLEVGERRRRLFLCLI